MAKQKKKTLRWHPAFYAGIQIELREDADRLEFIQEHTLGTEPVRIDMLIIKKADKQPLHKNIGRIFRTYNVIEYKSPDDTLSIDAFYKAYGYVNFYKALTGNSDNIKITEVTLTLVCSHYPRKLIRHLKEVRGYGIRTDFPGIYDVTGDFIPIQILLTHELPEDENLWLRNLNNRISTTKTIGNLLTDYEPHKADPLYRTVMDIIVRANKKKFEEVHSEMCDALMELMKEELEDARDSGRDEGRNEGIQALINACRSFGISPGKIAAQLMEQYGLSREQAIQYLDQNQN